MIKSRKTLNAFLFTICFSLFSCNGKQDSKIGLETNNKNNDVENDIKIERMLTNFYTAYIKEIASGDLKFEKKLDSLKNLNCTKILLDSIANEFEENELDYDPFINAQDASMEMIKTLSIKKINNSKNKFNVQYLDEYSGRKTNMKITIVEENGDFKISSLK